ncbi:5-methyltetrahydropteroyltriglutamate--homocysteine S-methyltransferase [Enterococcus sp. BWB1-3]|uniref:5-methyltetrahydropteroyltriglutamate-- homocysteine S-methyltransferase n=1 Tax=unclassified Enterococcus TaxID=2608891 RepID=UPI001922FC84|nr:MULTISPECIES: 5-methyltetrahydropteroyltriglutamate--homocysteine S-methyltransferase [unclassified Enterococcus]MBL1227797.1 5-methyltetrahydropteroyltriglutamate--homocysteine S-methyltransferase [Enterococcus sp. BWB1-3]MCB5952016.1 5-methyltetrahydropteroyltriglutamate--homocysteine S-methyltransferase [Enterococcus sp. BWT-B8]MCB5954574.1 5-methyltetrahydropteroyltriglutamate--homocysteine S-methyltransferase [Enterococcus sp. CWB-B31]
MKTTVVGFPRIGENRELKAATENYFRGDSTQEELLEKGRQLRKTHWQLLRNTGISYIPSNDFSFYDTVLDTAVLLNIIPKRFLELKLSPLDTYFALARGYQAAAGDVTALPMKKWFNTNYHYLTPEFEQDTEVRVVGTKIFDEYLEAKELGIETRPVILGPFTLIQLADFTTTEKAKHIPALISAYKEIILKLNSLGAHWLQLDEPALVKDLSNEDRDLFLAIYESFTKEPREIKLLLQTYFGDVRDVYADLLTLDVDGIGLDFVEGKQTEEFVRSFGFPQNKVLFAGIINGKNIWRNDYQKTVALLNGLPKEQVILSTSCSLLHVPFSIEQEEFPEEVSQHFSFAKEKLKELSQLSQIVSQSTGRVTENQQLFQKERVQKNEALADKLAALTEQDFHRQISYEERAQTQKIELNLPLLPTTTIGSFPQTRDVKAARARFKRGELDQLSYKSFLRKKIADCIEFQEDIDLDVLVHGEFERNDMVEYFGENLEGFLFSKNAWVQSYGTRCVKPPIIWGDVSRKQAITVEWSAYAQGLTAKPVKGMLTGPVTILNWSFPREDISLKDSTLQIALAIQEEVLDLEANGIKIIQIDEAALREKLPLRKSDWYKEYLDWAIPAFRLVHSKVAPHTQIHTHMCYSEFADILPAIDQMDADVISFEASRSNLALLDELKSQKFQTAVGPGVYDIHSPRVPSVAELTATIEELLKKISAEKLWINPDCGLKTRGEKETVKSLANLTKAAIQTREALVYEPVRE